MPRLVRRKPWDQRLKDYLNPQDFLLWLSEEIETREWDSKAVANWLGGSLNFCFLLARANSAGRGSEDDVFGDRGGAVWFSWVAAFLVHVLTWICLGNAAFTFLRTRHYRLFESSVEIAPSTPSAQRVKVDSSPVSSSPLRFLKKIISTETAESRAHPDPTRDVWEIAVWDPLPVCLRLFCLFSPGHVLVYWLFFPTLPMNPRPTTTVITTIILEVLLSAQLLLLQSSFSQQSKDTSIIHKEVLNEYDVKFVHPRMNVPVRDVGTQYTEHHTSPEEEDEVVTYTPTTIIKREFKVNPNPNYAKYVDPDNTGTVQKRPVFSPNNSSFHTPAPYNRRDSTPIRTVLQPQFRQSTTGFAPNSSNVSTGISDGGSLGVYAHANSPLKKATSLYDMHSSRREMPRNSLQAAERELMEERERERSKSPTKRLQEAEKENVRRRTTIGPTGLEIGQRGGETQVKRLRRDF